MSHDFPERDWRVLRDVKDAALQRFCQRVLDESDAVIRDASLTPHERYLKLFDLIRDRDRDIQRAFDDLRRSTATLRLLAMRTLGVVTDEEIQAFTPETRERSEPWERSTAPPARRDRGSQHGGR
jgi:hypothetical protein